MAFIILDRDGVINHDSPNFIRSPEQWIPLPGALEAIARLTAAGHCVGVATNQSGLARGLFDAGALDAMHAKLHRQLAPLGGRIDHIAVCPHGPASYCDCRKPKPGLLLQLARYWDLQDLVDVPVVGDSARDLEAAHSCGARPVLVRTGNGGRTEASPAATLATAVYPDLAAFVDDWLARPERLTQARAP